MQKDGHVIKNILLRSEKEPWKLILKLSLVFLVAISFFGIFYALLTNFTENGLTSTNPIGWFDYFYFSIVTVSTLGYGDINPVGFSKILICFEVLFGLLFVGYSLSQVLSARQEYLIGYLTTDRILQTYSECLASIADAKESIGDRRRLLQLMPPDPNDFILNRANPFYSALRAIEVLNGYTAHVEEIGQAKALSSQVERAAHHVEELASFVRKYLNILIAKKAVWETNRTKKTLNELCNAIEEFSNSYTVHTRYAVQEYKGGGDYGSIVRSIISQIRTKI